MSTTQASQAPAREKLFGTSPAVDESYDDFPVRTEKKQAPPLELLNKVAAENNFPSRQAQPAYPMAMSRSEQSEARKNLQAAEMAEILANRPRRGRPPSKNRPLQINMKITVESHKDLYAMANHLNVPLPDVVEAALALYMRQVFPDH